MVPFLGRLRCIRLSARSVCERSSSAYLHHSSALGVRSPFSTHEMLDPRDARSHHHQQNILCSRPGSANLSFGMRGRERCSRCSMSTVLFELFLFQMTENIFKLIGVMCPSKFSLMEASLSESRLRLNFVKAIQKAHTPRPFPRTNGKNIRVSLSKSMPP